jgi:uncharacterized protein (TIGR04255 family)
MQLGPFPEYDRPPVVETILGVQFQPLAKFSNGHLGAYWKILGSKDWPTLTDAPPLEPQFEQFTEEARWIPAGVLMKLSQDLSSRLQMKNEKGDQMIQLQNGRLIFNWLGTAGTGYPGYPAVRARFVSAVEQLVRFLADEQLGSFQPNQWEVTYLNHIPKGTVWQSAHDWGFFKPLGAVPTLNGLIEGESFGGGWHFRLPGERGRLHIQWQHARTGQGKEIIVLNLTARGWVMEQENRVAAVLNGLDVGRRTIVSSFAQLMSKQANDYWGLKHAGN